MERGCVKEVKCEISDISWESFDLSFRTKIICKFLINSNIDNTSVAANSAFCIMDISSTKV